MQSQSQLGSRGSVTYVLERNPCGSLGVRCQMPGTLSQLLTFPDQHLVERVPCV